MFQQIRVSTHETNGKKGNFSKETGDVKKNQVMIFTTEKCNNQDEILISLRCRLE